jgi:hypothetical protein
MKVAVTYEKETGKVFQHCFSTMPSFLLKNPAASSALQPFLRT